MTRPAALPWHGLPRRRLRDTWLWARAGRPAGLVLCSSLCTLSPGTLPAASRAAGWTDTPVLQQENDPERRGFQWRSRGSMHLPPDPEPLAPTPRRCTPSRVMLPPPHSASGRKRHCPQCLPGCGAWRMEDLLHQCQHKSQGSSWPCVASEPSSEAIKGNI